MENMKDSKSDWFALELSVLKQLFKEGPKNEQTLDMDSGKRGRMLSELLKQGLIDHSPKGLRITTRGKYLLTCKQS